MTEADSLSKEWKFQLMTIRFWEIKMPKLRLLSSVIISVLFAGLFGKKAFPRSKKNTYIPVNLNFFIGTTRYLFIRWPNLRLKRVSAPMNRESIGRCMTRYSENRRRKGRGQLLIQSQKLSAGHRRSALMGPVLMSALTPENTKMRLPKILAMVRRPEYPERQVYL